MSDNTRIAWTEATWNPIVGCSKVSPGCKACYAERMAVRLARMGQVKYAAVVSGERRWTGGTHLDESALDQPLRWRRPRRIFVCSMGDLFHESVADEQIAAVFGVMAAAPQHTFQVLTKRAERARRWFTEWLPNHAAPGEEVARCWAYMLRHGMQDFRAWPGSRTWPLPHVWLGTTCEDQQRADERIPHLLATPAAVRFVSVEPMLGEIDLRRLTLVRPQPPNGPGAYLDALTGHIAGPDEYLDERLSWVIVGAESGPGMRPMGLGWAHSVVTQCQSAGVAVFVKQLHLDGRLSKDPAEWPADLRARETPEVGRG